jgi:hypothetical protein
MPRPRRPGLFRFPAVAGAVAILALAGVSNARADAIDITATPVPLNPDDPSQATVGKLVYRGGLVLTSSETRFGGLSALGVSADGKRLLAVTDKGKRFFARPTYDAHGNLVAVADTHMDNLITPSGRPLILSDETDAEAMAPGVDGSILVAFERDHRIWRYPPDGGPPEPIPPPDELKYAPANGGIEGLTLLKDGRLFAITEDFAKGGRTVGWVSSEEGWSVLTYAANDGFKPTDATTLPDGDVVVLERYFTLRGSGAARLKRIKGNAIIPGAHLEGALLAELRPPLTVDNMEGIAARRTDDGRTLLYLVSDDNFSRFQRTLLMMFELKE